MNELVKNYLSKKAENHQKVRNISTRGYQITVVFIV